MNTKTRPGLQIYSEAWMAETATKVAEPLRPVVRAICESYNLGDSDDPNLIAQIIERELSAQCSQWEHRIHRDGDAEEDSADLQWVQPDALEFDRISGYWFYAVNGYHYSPDEIVARRRKP